MTWAEHILKFLFSVSLDGVLLPRGVRVMNPMKESGKETRRVVEAFYRKFYEDNRRRRLIVGINPGRFGAGVTGIPFTDTKRLENLGIRLESAVTHEPSSVFIHETIDAFGGPARFFGVFYITALCPLGFVRRNAAGREVNYNYYDDERLERAVTPFIIASMKAQLAWGCETDVCFCLGSGKNFRFFEKLNEREKFFDKIVPLDHPRFIMQYRLKKKSEYVKKYVAAFRGAARQGSACFTC